MLHLSKTGQIIVNNQRNVIHLVRNPRFYSSKFGSGHQPAVPIINRSEPQTETIQIDDATLQELLAVAKYFGVDDNRNEMRSILQKNRKLTLYKYHDQLPPLAFKSSKINLTENRNVPLAKELKDAARLNGTIQQENTEIPIERSKLNAEQLKEIRATGKFTVPSVHYDGSHTWLLSNLLQFGRESALKFKSHYYSKFKEQIHESIRERISGSNCSIKQGIHTTKNACLRLFDTIIGWPLERSKLFKTQIDAQINDLVRESFVAKFGERLPFIVSESVRGDLKAHKVLSEQTQESLESIFTEAEARFSRIEQDLRKQETEENESRFENQPLELESFVDGRINTAANALLLNIVQEKLGEDWHEFYYKMNFVLQAQQQYHIDRTNALKEYENYLIEDGKFQPFKSKKVNEFILNWEKENFPKYLKELLDGLNSIDSSTEGHYVAPEALISFWEEIVPKMRAKREELAAERTSAQISRKIYFWKGSNYKIETKQNKEKLVTSSTINLPLNHFGWRFSCGLVKCAAWLNNINLAILKRNLWNGPVGLKALFSIEPFPINHTISDGKIVQDRSYLQATFYSNLKKVVDDLLAQRNKFENNPDEGLIGKSVGRILNVLWCYTTASIKIGAIVALQPAATFINCFVSSFLSLTSPIWVPWCTVIDYLSNCFLFDYELSKICRMQGTGELVYKYFEDKTKELRENFVPSAPITPQATSTFSYSPTISYSDHKRGHASLFPVITDVFYGAIFGPGIAAMSIVGALLYHPILGVSYRLLGIGGGILQRAWDTIMFNLVVQPFARVPERDDFFATRIDGPNVDKTKEFVSINIDDAVCYLQLQLEMRKLEAFKFDQLRKLQSARMKLYSIPIKMHGGSVENYEKPLVRFSLNYSHPIYSTVNSKTNTAVNNLQYFIDQRKRELRDKQISATKMGDIRFTAEQLEQLISKAAVEIEKYYTNEILPYYNFEDGLFDKNLSAYQELYAPLHHDLKGLVSILQSENKWHILAKEIIRDSFSSEALNPVDEVSYDSTKAKGKRKLLTHDMDNMIIIRKEKPLPKYVAFSSHIFTHPISSSNNQFLYHFTGSWIDKLTKSNTQANTYSKK